MRKARQRRAAQRYAQFDIRGDRFLMVLIVCLLMLALSGVGIKKLKPDEQASLESTTSIKTQNP